MNISRITPGLTTLLLLFLLYGCYTPTQVYRVDEREQIDLSGRWNDIDSQMVSDEMINSCLSDPWQGYFVERQGRLPVVLVGTVYNKTDEHISADTFIKELERAFVNSGRARIVQSGAAVDELRAIRFAQQDFAAPETQKRLREELGADLVIQGLINKISDRDGDRMVYFYQVDLELIDLESSEKVWLGQKKLKKYAEKSMYRR